MKSLKMFFSTLLLLFVSCPFISIQATYIPRSESTHKAKSEIANKTVLPIYQNSIKEITLSYEGTMLIGMIKLNNDLVLRIVDYKTRDDSVLNNWHAGDVVAFKASMKDDVLILSFSRVFGPDKGMVEPYVIFDATKSPQSGLMIAEINEDGKFVKLNDHSVWEFSWYNRLSSKYWNVGERVIVCGQGDKNCYDFINVDTPVAKNSSSATASFVVH